MAELPSPVPPGEKSPRVRKAVYLAVMLHVAVHQHLAEEQKHFVAVFQSKLNLDQVQLSLDILHKLETNPRMRARLQVADFKVPFFRNSRPQRREQRRIGVGYRDKGSLRPSHRPALPGELTVDREGLEGLFLAPGELRPEELRLRSEEVMLRWRMSMPSRLMTPGSDPREAYQMFQTTSILLDHSDSISEISRKIRNTWEDPLGI